MPAHDERPPEDLPDPRTTAGLTGELVLPYDRIDDNRHKTALYLVLFSLLLLPVLAYVGEYLMFVAFLGVALLMPAGDMAVIIVLAASCAVAMVLGTAALQYRYATALLLRIAHARPADRAVDAELVRTVENVAIGAGVPPPAVFVVEDPHANAFSTGLDPQRASLVVTRGLLTLLDRRELEGVVAHEIAHIRNYDTRLATVTATALALLRLPASLLARFVGFLFRLHPFLGGGCVLYFSIMLLSTLTVVPSLFEGDDDGFVAVVLFAMSVPFYVLFIAPMIGQVLRQGVSRERHLLADAEAVLLTRYAPGLARALAKMTAGDAARVDVNPAVSHLWTVDPLPAAAPIWHRPFLTHPPADDRIAQLARTGGAVAPAELEAAARIGTAFADRMHSPETSGVASLTGGLAEEAGPVAGAHDPKALRLSRAAALYAGPDDVSSIVAELPAGSLVTVQGAAGGFFHVLSADNRFGYLSRAAPAVAVDLEAVFPSGRARHDAD